MKKCMIMFALTMLMLILAMLTEKSEENSTKEDYVLTDQVRQDIAFEQLRPSEKSEIKNQ